MLSDRRRPSRRRGRRARDTCQSASRADHGCMGRPSDDARDPTRPRSALAARAERLPTTMFAAYVERLGPTDEIRYGSLPVPTFGPTDVLVHVTATTVNPVDAYVRAGRFPTPLAFPFVLGRDLVGTVAAVGSAATGFAVGDRVWSNSLGHGGRQGPAAEYATVAADRLYPLPDGVDPITAVAIAHPAATAYLALIVHGVVLAGETVYVGGAAGNVGSAAVVLAARAGAHVIASARTEDHAYCRELGADHVIDYRDPNAQQALRDVAPGGIDVYLDTSGRQDLAPAVEALARRGRIVAIAGMNDRITVPVGPLYRRDASVRGFAISNATVDELAAAAQLVSQLLVEGVLAPRRTEELPLTDMAQAHDRIESGAAHGQRLIIRPDRA